MAQETSDMNEPVLHPAPAEGFGAALKRAREAQGISIGDMAARSRLSVQQVRALESERTAELPEPVYVRAFIRGVASVLGLEPDPPTTPPATAPQVSGSFPTMIPPRRPSCAPPAAARASRPPSSPLLRSSSAPQAGTPGRA